ncbi:hypothetical protein pb186bvf_018206 [Paramecium bursaria]
MIKFSEIWNRIFLIFLCSQRKYVNFQQLFIQFKMGSKLAVPQSVHDTRSNKELTFEVNVTYCHTCGFLDQAEYIQQAVTIVYPKAKVNLIQAKTGMFGNGQLDVEVVKKDGKEIVHKRKEGDGSASEKNIQLLVDKIKAFVE